MNAPFQYRSIAVTTFLGFLFTAARAFAQIPENVLVNDPSADTTARDTQSGTAIVRGQGDSVIVAFNDSGSNVGAANHFVGWARSTNGGASFTDMGRLPDSPPGDAGFMNLARDNQTGVVYLSSLGFSTAGLNVFRSVDNGGTFISPPTPVTNGNADVSSFAVDNFPGTGQGSLYLTWREFGPANAILFSKSTNAGITFSAPILIQSTAAGNVHGPALAVASDHSIYIAYLDEAAPKSIKIRRSTNLGASFGPAVTVAGVTSAGINGNLGLGFTSVAFPKLAVNPVNGALYIVYPDKGPGSDRADIYFTQSTDGGVTWSPRVKVNNDSTTNDQYQPVIAVTPNGSRLFIGFYDRRRDPNNSLIDVFGMVASASGGPVTPGANFRISSESFPAVYGQDPGVNATFMGYYDTATADNNFFYYPWGDNRLGNSFHANQPDVRMAKIPVAGISVPEVSVESVALAGNPDDNAISPDECNSLTVHLRNTGTVPLTNVSVQASSSDRLVSVVQPNSAYPHIDVGASATNIDAFGIRTSANFPCFAGTTLTLNIASDQGQFSYVITLQGNSVANVTGSFTFSNVVTLPLLDNSTVQSNMSVFGLTDPIIKATVRLHLTHTYDQDLNIRLIAPNGTVVPLSLRRGGSGDNFGTACSPDSSMTLFDDDAPTAISAGVPPFSGAYRPESPLSVLRGLPAEVANGNWQLEIQDVLSQDTGTLQCWKLEIQTGYCLTGEGPCDPTAARNWTLYE